MREKKWKTWKKKRTIEMSGLFNSNSSQSIGKYSNGWKMLEKIEMKSNIRS